MRRASEFFRRRSDKKRLASHAERPASHGDRVDPILVGDRVCDFLRGVYPARTADNVAADLAGWRVKAGTIAKMLERRSPPGWQLTLALTSVYGPEYLCAVLPDPPAWLDAARRAERQAALEAEAAAIGAELGALEELR